jgi:beta-lactamase class A
MEKNFRKFNIILFILIIILILESFFVSLLLNENNKLKRDLKEHSYNFSLLSPNIAFMETEEFLNLQKQSFINYWGLKSKILSEIKKYTSEENVGIYFEDLFTGSWIGINEKEGFYPKSLFKVPVMVTILKKIEEGELSFDQNITLTERDIDNNSGNLWKKGINYKISIKN